MNLGRELPSIMSATAGRPAALNGVLIAEDDPLFRQILSSWLKEWDYRVVAVENGADAWEILQQPDAPRLAILDWMMPGVDGIELCRRVRRLEGGVYRYILLATAKDDTQDVIAGLEAGADDYLTKPFSMQELRARIRAGERILQLQNALLRAQNALRQDAAHDPLTGVWNRSAALELLLREMHRHERTGQPLGLMLLEVDDWTNLNETYGRVAGEAVLRGVAEQIKASVRTYDLVGRYVGEAFMVVLPGCGPAEVIEAAERLRGSVEDLPLKTLMGTIAVPITVGVAAAVAGRQPAPDYLTLLADADEGLRLAKSKGGDRVGARPDFLARNSVGQR